MALRRWLRCALLAGCSLGLVAALSAPLPARAEESTKVLLLLDVSGSMNEPISSGGTKFAAAKRALKKVADAMPAGTQVGLRVYGSRIAEPKECNPKACTDTELVMPIGPLNKAKMYRAVDSFTAKGETPIAYSLERSVEDLGSGGKRVLVLISDGEETCSGDPCPVARKLSRSGVDLQFNAVGLAVNEKARRQLQCIAKAGDGNYYDAGNTSDLEDAIRRITQRALRPFQSTGTPVRGTPAPGEAPRVGPGQYRDRYDPSGTARHYRIPRIPGSTVTASIGTIVRPYPTQNTETWTLTMATPDGTACATTRAVSASWRAVNALGGSVSTAQVDPITGDPPPEVCASAPELLVSLARQSPLGNDDDVAVELVIAEEPPIANLAALPEPVTDYSGRAGGVRAGRAEPVLGGTSFSNSTEIGPGSWTDSVATGETVFYRVRLQTGQRVRVTATTPAPESSWQLGPAEGLTSRLMVFSPARSALTVQQAPLQGNRTVSLTAASPPVRVRNRELPPPVSYLDPSVSTASLAGEYYLALQLDPLQKFLTGRVMQVRLSVAVEGRPGGQPVYATATTPEPTPPPPTPSAEPTPTDPPGAAEPGLPIWVAVLGAGVLAAGLVAGSVAWNRRRNRPAPVRHRTTTRIGGGARSGRGPAVGHHPPWTAGSGRWPGSSGRRWRVSSPTSRRNGPISGPG